MVVVSRVLRHLGECREAGERGRHVVDVEERVGAWGRVAGGGGGGRCRK